MKTGHIKKLLERYYKGESSSDDEMILSNYFKQEENIPEEFVSEREIFSYYTQKSAIPIPDTGFENRIISAFDRKYPHKRKNTKRIFLMRITGVAAGLLIIAGIYLMFLNKTEPRDTFTDPDIAYAETMRILYDVSYNINRGKKAVESVGIIPETIQQSLNTINKSTLKIEEELQTLNQLRKKADILSNDLKYREK